ncbi:tRNA pseudouridine(13) synthase TruD [Legionella sp. km772]|uniref:tRNA pseudouridine(13) synthase TruD n=1 Tax=Legionella sp. km772 TaxID=2498111 RepID=UPI000F8D9547|nr:tRNA pseudouridine(13) synthase TruD [Legionella sp. km772]RUR11304.1 tRNA pseudouridine(13) synthase TruD [Legionella sp. km772]
MYSLNYPYAYGGPESSAQFKATPEDFQVNEFFKEAFSGEGEHILLKIEKRGLNTEEVIRSLARLINKSPKLISYAGLKDKQALTTQWLSVHAPGEEIPGIAQLSAPGWRILACTRHNKKLKPGFLTGNQFIIRLQDVSDIDDFKERVQKIMKGGVPNYFGEQRFGRQGANLIRAEEVLVQGRKVKDKFLRGLYYSAARSWLFNLILAKRVEHGTWNTLIPGDVLQLNGSNSIFVAEQIDELLLQRVKDKDLSPASPLPGKTKNKVKGQAEALIQNIYAEWQTWLSGLEQQGLEEAWRANILHVEQLTYEIDGGNITLSFSLPAGTYATTVLRELVKYN